MFWKPRLYSLLGQDDEEWQLDCWAWLIRNFGGLEALRRTPLVVPTVEFFERPGPKDHPAEHYFCEVVRLVGLEDWPFKLEEQDYPVNPAVGPLAVVQNAPGSPAGTFSVQSQNEILITYSPDLISQPEDLIATFAHEIGHAVVLNIGEEPVGGWDCHEFATDLCAAAMGFGVFGANSAFRFAQSSDAGSGSQGWSYRRSGYLTQPEWSFAIAIFLKLKDEAPDQALRFLNDGPAALLKKSLRYLDAHPQCVETIVDQLEA